MSSSAPRKKFWTTSCTPAPEPVVRLQDDFSNTIRQRPELQLPRLTDEMATETIAKSKNGVTIGLDRWALSELMACGPFQDDIDGFRQLTEDCGLRPTLLLGADIPVLSKIFEGIPTLRRTRPMTVLATLRQLRTSARPLTVAGRVLGGHYFRGMRFSAKSLRHVKVPLQCRIQLMILNGTNQWMICLR